MFNNKKWWIRGIDIEKIVNEMTKESAEAMIYEIEKQLPELFDPPTGKEEIEFKSSNGFCDSILDILQNHINQLVIKNWEWDQQCKPIFYVSIMTDLDKRDNVMLTIDHRGVKFTELLFPRSDAHWGYDSLFDEMEQMFNRTM